MSLIPYDSVDIHTASQYVSHVPIVTGPQN